ncbi:MAG: hypothetical protein IJW60_03330 [Clostridia bacterium]|nr:hypothetical protein [Clostridia bacterium]
MKDKMRKFLLTVCCLAFAFMSALGFVACGIKPLKIEFNTIPYEYAKGNVVDVFDLVKKEAGVEYSFEMSYLTQSESGETVSSDKAKIEGTTYYLSVASRYTLYVTATRAQKSVQDTMEFDVVGETPVLLVPSTTLVYNVGAKVRVNILIDRISPIVIPASSNMVVDYYTYQENQSVKLDNTTNTNPKVKTELDDPNDLSYKVPFEEEGLYEFHMIANNGDRTADSTFKVAVLPDQSAKIDGISAYKNAEFGANEDGSVDSSVVRLIGSDDLAKASYVVLDEDFTGGQVARFEFYGRNVPYIGLFNNDYDAVVDPNSITNGGIGYTFTMERATVANQVRLYGCTRMSSKSSPLRSSSNLEEYAFEHWGFTDFEEDKHYFLEIMMKPTGKLSENPTGWGGEFLKGGTYQDMGLYFIVYEINEESTVEPYTVVAYSSTRFNTGISSWFEEGEDVKGKLVAYSSISKDITFKYYEDTLLDATFDKTAIDFDKDTKTLSWAAVDGAVNYIVTKGNSDMDRIAVLDATQTSLDISALYDELDYFQVVNLNVYASIGNNTYSGKKYECMVNKEAAGMENILVSGNIVGYDIDEKTLSVSLAGGYYNTSAANIEQKNSADTSRTAMGYVAFDRAYTLDENGTFIDVYFTGNNMPSVEFFASEINGLFMDDFGHATDGTGFIVSNGLAAANGSATNTTLRWGYSGYRGYFNYGVSPYAERWIGAEDWQLGVIAPSNGSIAVHDNKNNTDATLTYSDFSMYSLANLQSAEQNYRYNVGMYKDTDGFVWLAARLYKLDGETETLFAAWKGKVSLAGATSSVSKDKLAEGESISGKIVVHAAAKGVDEKYEPLSNEFTCGVPYVGSAAEHYWPEQNVQHNADGTVTVQNGNGGQQTITKYTSGYIVLDDDYRLGEYVDVYFTGDNMPHMSFFAKQVTNCLDNGSTGFVMQNGSTYADGTTYYPQSAGSLLIYSPNRTLYNQDGGDMNGKSLGSKHTLPANADLTHALSMYRLAEIETTTKFKMTVGFYENAEGKVEMSIDVKKLNGETWTDYFAWTKASTLDAETDAAKLGKYLIAYGTQRAKASVTFSYTAPYTK